MLDELKKIRNDRSAKILFLIIILVSIAVSIAPIKSFTVIESGENSNLIKGKPAISVLKERYENSKGELSIEKINEVLNHYKTITGTDTAYLESNNKYPGIISLLADAYSPGATIQLNNLNHIENGNDFYDRNIKKIANILDDSPNDYKSWEKSVILDKARSIDRPFVVDFSKQWTKAYSSLTVIFIMIGLSAIIIGSKLFSYEKERGMDFILATFGNKKLQTIGKNKIFALLVFLTIAFLMSVSIISIILFWNTGVSGWSSQIQIEYFTSIYNLTFGSAYLLFIFMAWVSLLAIGTVVATINSFMQKSYVSLVIGFLVVFIPFIAIRIGSLPLSIRKFMEIQPVNGFVTVGNILSLRIFKFGFINCLTTTAIILCSMIITIICILLAPRLFSTRIKNA